MNVDFYFPTPIWWMDSHLDNNTILEYCLKKKEEDPAGRQISNRGGWQSDEVDLKTDLPHLVNFIMDHSTKTIYDYGYDSDRTKLFFGNSWININRGNNTNQVHMHHGSFLSGVYYVKTTEQSGNICFYRNYDQSFIITSYSKVVNHTSLSSAAAYYPPKDGRLILFPSNLLHSVEASEDDEERISIAFNLGITYD